VGKVIREYAHAHSTSGEQKTAGPWMFTRDLYTQRFLLPFGDMKQRGNG
jgi:hypothetical protein